MNILQQAQAKREALQRELARIEAFLATAYELQQEFVADQTKPAAKSDSQKADMPAPARRVGQRGSGSVTLHAVADILRERGVPMSTRELLPLVRAKGIEVGGKDALATLSARISQKGVVTVRAGKWWFINDLKASGAQASEEEEAADDPTKEQSTASMFTQEGGSQWNRLNV